MASFAQFGNDLYTGKRSIDFIGRRKLWYLIAAVAVVISIGALTVKHLNPGIEFRGGSEFRISKTAVTDEQVGQDAVHSVVAGAKVTITRLGSDGIRVEADQLSDVQLDAVKTALAKGYQVPATNVSQSFVGPTWGADVTRQALIGLMIFLVLVALVITLYFRTWTMAVSALVALLHDLLLTVGIYALVGFEVTPASVIGFLTILGYSLYDTVVVFDKVRENTDHIKDSTRRTFDEAANLAVNQTLVRSINTSVVALLPVASILFIGAFLLGAGTLKDISLALFVGIAAGTYSSIFIATPLLVDLRRREPDLIAQAERVRRRRESAGTDGATATGGEPALAGVAGGAGAGGDSAADPGPGTLRPATGGQRAQPKRNRPSGRSR
jgi:preprotein translocase subunit SecF